MSFRAFLKARNPYFPVTFKDFVASLKIALRYASFEMTWCSILYNYIIPINYFSSIFNDNKNSLNALSQGLILIPNASFTFSLDIYESIGRIIFVVYS